MGLRIYNSLTNKLEDFKPLDGNKVNMYVCGPTVYNYIHIGNARPVIFFDTLKRYLEFSGYTVSYASNITDVDDKIINKAIEEGVSEKEVATRYADVYFTNVKDLGAKKPDYTPYATEYIQKMIDFIQELKEQGYTYEVDGDVYFRVSKINDYGVLSNQQAEFLDAGVRKSVDTKKEDPRDFVLWKKTDKGIKWDSPFGVGRPGWHTECVVMSHDIYHTMLDIHGGGMDLKFPHHENEIAQCNALYHNHLAKYWMHVGRLDMNGEKMSKSLGNVVRVVDLSKEDLMILRLLIVTAPYRSNINYNDELLTQYKNEYAKITRAYKAAALKLDLAGVENTSCDNEAIEKFKEYMDNDLNTPNVLTLVQTLVKEINQIVRTQDNEALAVKVNTLKTIMGVLGVELTYTKLTEENKELYNKWNAFKKEKNFEEADKIRAILTERGIL
ncbi:MAG: cysteine--tRNA ligase [Acholeplasmatales bacterium]|nr:cysteine--tRNA ligase [Acholeplasmatales bacterium]